MTEVTPNPDDALPSNTVRCPTCRAVQEWSDTCRRCQSDLRLLRAAATSYLRDRRLALLRLRAGDPCGALGPTRRAHQLRPGPASARLLASCALLCGDWASAAALALD